MGRMLTLLLGMLATAGMLATGSTIFAAPPMDGGKGGLSVKERMESRHKAVFEKLNLTQEQEERLQANRLKHQERAAELFKRKTVLREELRADLQKPDLDMAKIQGLHGTLKEIHGKLADQRLDGILEVREILTPEQFAQFIQLTGDRKARKWKRHGMEFGQ